MAADERLALVNVKIGRAKKHIDDLERDIAAGLQYNWKRRPTGERITNN